MKPLIVLLIAVACLPLSSIKAQPNYAVFDKDIVAEVGNYQPLIGRVRLPQNANPARVEGTFTDNYGVDHPAALVTGSAYPELAIHSSLGKFTFSMGGSTVPNSLKPLGKVNLRVQDHASTTREWEITLSQWQGTPLLDDFAGTVSGHLRITTNAQGNITDGELFLPKGSNLEGISCPIYGGFVSPQELSTVVNIKGRNFVFAGVSSNKDFNFDSQMAVYGNGKSSIYLLWSGSSVASPSDGVVAYWKMNESGGTRRDSSGNGNNLTSVNGVKSATGIRGDCARFDGSNYLQTKNFGVPVNSDFTVSAWVHLPHDQSAGGAHILGDYDGNGIFFANDTPGLYRMRLFVSPDSHLGFSAPAEFGKWQHLVFVRSGDLLYGYSNGASLGAPVSVAGKLFPGGSTFYVGAHAAFGSYGEWQITGGVDEVGVWNRALTASEVARLYNSGHGLRP